MIALTVKSKTLTTMFRKGCMDFNAFPATIALEKVEAKALFVSSPPKRHVNVPNSFTSVSPCQAMRSIEDKFPKIEWEEDDANSAYEERQQGICSFGADCSELLLRSPKRRKLTCGFLKEYHGRRDKKALIRTQRILTKLDLLDHGVEDYAPILVANTSSSRQQTMPVRGPQFSSLGDRCDVDPDMEKLLQMSFLDDGGDYQVTIVA